MKVTANITGSKVTTWLGIIIASALAIAQIWAGHPTLEHFILDSAIAVVGLLMHDGIFKVPEPVQKTILDVEAIAKQLDPALEWYLKTYPGKFSSKAEAILGYMKDPEVKKLLDQFTEGKTN